ncbi:MAG: hypothetical protein ACJ72N_01175 [Labedaea sp.]
MSSKPTPGAARPQQQQGLGSARRRDPGSNIWQNVKMPEKYEDPFAATVATFALKAGTTLTFHYRLSLAADTSASDSAAVLYTVYLPYRVQVGMATVPGKIGEA